MSSKSSIFARGRVALAVLALAGLAWAANFIVLPRYHEHTVERVLDAYARLSAEKSKEVSEIRGLAREERLARTIELLAAKAALPEPERIAAIEAAIGTARSEQATVAMLIGAIAVRDGHAGAPDSQEALVLFEEAAETIAPMVRAGLPEALFVQAWLHGEGLGVPQDQGVALAMMQRAVPSLRGAHLMRAIRHSDNATGPFAGAPDAERTISMALPAIGEGNLRAYVIAGFACKEGGSSGLTETLALAYYEKQRACEARIAQFADKAGLPVGFVHHGVAQLELHGDIETAAERFNRQAFNMSSEPGLLIGLVNAIVASSVDDFVAALRGLKIALDADGRRQRPSDPELRVRQIVHVFDRWVASSPPDGQLKRFALALTLMGEMAPAYTLRISYLYNTPGWDSLLAYLDSAKDPEVLHALLAQTRQPAAADDRRGVPAAPTAGRPAALASAAFGTGYVGQAPAEDEGLSSFNVDNTDGGGDAIVRLYHIGGTKAPRTFSVRQGDQFTVRGLAAGDYKMRYRYNGSSATYEALETFALREEPTEDGRRYSRIEVTLYRVDNGNMRTAEVAPEDF